MRLEVGRFSSSCSLQMKPGALLIRADASVAIGTGHVMRCLALAQAWQDAGGRAVFAMAHSTPAVGERLRAENCAVVTWKVEVGSADDTARTCALAREVGARWVVADGYELGADYQLALKQNGFRVLFIDDNGHCGAYVADVVLNQNIHAGADLYRNRSPHTSLLLGTQYALLRREFLCLRGYHREIPTVARKLLVTMGGSDPGNVTLRVLDAIDQVTVSGLEMAVVVGGSNPHTASIKQRVAACRHGCRLLSNVIDMTELIRWADLAVSAAGTVCWEYCLAGLPAVLLATADNQIAAAMTLHAAGAAILAGKGDEIAGPEMAAVITRLVNSPAERQSVSRKAQTVVDGRGAERTLSSLLGANAS